MPTTLGTPRRARVGRAGMLRRAYTLVEVLIVVTILGIAGAMVVPSFAQTHVLRVQAAVRTVVADLTTTQSDAVAYQRGRAVVFHPGDNRYTIVEVKGGAIDEALDRLEARDFLDAEFGNAVISAVSFAGGTTVCFDELGSPVPPPGSGAVAAGGSLGGYVEIQGSGQTYRITIEPFTGRITVQQM